MSILHTTRRTWWPLAAAILVYAGAGTTGRAEAQVSAAGPASTALGGGGAAYVYGSEAIFRNPANLALDQTGIIEISLGGAQVSAGGNLLQFGYYNDLFTSGRTITDDEARGVVDAWFGGAESEAIRRVGVSIEAVPLTVIHGIGGVVLGYGIRARTMSSAGINGGWLDLLLTGTGEDRTIPLHGEFGVMSTTELSVAAGRLFRGGRLAVGLAPKLILGNEFVDARLRSTATLSADAIIHDFEYRVRAAGGLSRDLVDGFDLFSSDVFSGGSVRPNIVSTTGIGAGIDLGVTFLPSPGLRLSAAITDVGFVRWKGDSQVIRPRENQFTFEGLTLDIDRVRDEFDGDLGDYFTSTIDSLASGAYDHVEKTYAPFTTTIPTAIHFGAEWVAPGGRLLVAGGTSAPITSSVIQVATPPELHVGVEYSVGGKVRVPLRTGVYVGGSSALMLGLGLGIHTPHYDFDVGLAVSPRTDIVGAGGRYAGGVSALTIRF